MQEGAQIDLFRFVRRAYLPDVTSGQLVKTSGGYSIAVQQSGVTYNFSHSGNLDKPGLLYLVEKVKKSLQERRTAASQGISAERIRPMTGRKPVTKMPDRRVHKPTDRVDDVVMEQNGGFTPTGAGSIQNMAGDADGDHWVMATWDPIEFDTYDLSPGDRNFLKKHVAAIAHKVGPGAEPEIDYFTTADLAKERISVLQSKYGVPKVSGIRPMQ
jgi:hypothetical protein